MKPDYLSLKPCEPKLAMQIATKLTQRKPFVVVEIIAPNRAVNVGKIGAGTWVPPPFYDWNEILAVRKAAKEASATNLTQKILDGLKYGGELTAEDIASTLRHSYHGVSVWLGRMCVAGKIVRKKHPDTFKLCE